MQQPIDSKIKQAQRKGAGVYILSGLLTLATLAAFGLWLFFIKGFSLLIGPNEALNNAKVGLVSGFAWVGERKVYTLGGEVIIGVSSSTFESALVTIDGQSPSAIEILLLPSLAVIKGQASVGQNTPAESQYLAQTQWFLNGQLIHVGEKLLHKTAPGSYLLSVTNPYFETTTQSLELARAQEVTLTPALASVSGSITINSIPQNIAVSINGQLEGKTPIIFKAQGGEYDVSLNSSDYITINETIALQTRFLDPKRNYRLLPKPGVLNINALPSDGLLLINNMEYSLGQIDLAANKQHKIHYNKAGHAPYINTISVNKDADTAIDIRLTPLFGKVTISTNVPANLSINANDAELSPVTKRLLAVKQTVEAKAQGYRSVQQSFTPQANQSTNVNITLLTEFDARRAEGKPLFVNTLGITMRKFRGDAFTLGSPSNETGRRRNEHEVDLDFSRPFWVAEKEVTEAQFGAFLSTSQAPKSNFPVTGISWLEAVQYCNWLSQQEGLALFYRFQNGRYAGVNEAANGYRLPSEAEWEWLAKKAKRAISTVYVWGNQDKLQDNIGNFADKAMQGKQLIFFEEYEDGNQGIAEVGSYKADRAGLYDMAGNVSEWVNDSYTNALPDTSKRHIDYLGTPFSTQSAQTWVIKGGNYESGRLRELRAAFREFSATGKVTVGFRIARYDKLK